MLEGGNNSGIELKEDIWRGVKGFYLPNNPKKEIEFISIFLCLSDTQQERIIEYMIEMIREKNRIKEKLSNYIKKGKGE